MELSSENNQEIAPEMVWKRNSPYLYQILYTSALDWPSLTVEWLPDKNYDPKQKNQDLYTVNEIILGTNTSGQGQNYLMIAKIRVPCQAAIEKKYKQSKLVKSQTIKKNQEYMEQKIQIMHKIPHDGEVNRAKHNPHQRNYIATRTPTGPIHIFNTLHIKKQKVEPQIVLLGHDSQGYALEWNMQKVGHILAGSYNGQLSLWDINHFPNNKPKEQYSPLCNFEFHQIEIEDVSHHRYHDSIFASCDDAGNSVFWDTRKGNSPIYRKKAHQGTVYSIQFCPQNSYRVATGGADSMVKVWDLRNSSEPLFEMKEEYGQVTQVKWSNDQAHIIWSLNGKKATMWNITEQKPLFVHVGCRQTINYMDTCSNQPDTIAVVDDNNQIQIFQPNQNCKL